jgi:hypothetical protein
MLWRGDIRPPGRLWRFEAEHPLLTSLASGVVGAALFWLWWGWLSAVAWFIVTVLLGTLAWRPGGARRRRYEAQVAASRAPGDGTRDGDLHALTGVPAERSLAALTAGLSFLGAGWLFLLFAGHLVFGGTLTWGSMDLGGFGLGVGLATLMLFQFAAGLLCIKRRRVGLAIVLATGILGTIVSGVGLAAGGSAGPLPAAHWWLLVAAALTALVADVRNAHRS